MCSEYWPETLHYIFNLLSSFSSMQILKSKEKEPDRFNITKVMETKLFFGFFFTSTLPWPQAQIERAPLFLAVQNVLVEEKKCVEFFFK